MNRQNIDARLTVLEARPPAAAGLLSPAARCAGVADLFRRISARLGREGNAEQSANCARMAEQADRAATAGGDTAERFIQMVRGTATRLASDSASPGPLVD